MKKILFVFGTRPEAIKMAPLIHEFSKYQNQFFTKVCVSAQHRKMLDQVLDFFQIIPDYDLDLMTSNQTLHVLTANIISGLKPVFDEFNPDYVFVHGDTTTSFAAALAAFYSDIQVCHIEAGLRTFNKKSPFPEEMNRQLVGRISDFHFAPTALSKSNLLRDAVPKTSILVTGNTVIDALFLGLKKFENSTHPEVLELNEKLDFSKKIVLITCHRRENHGDGMISVCRALKQLSSDHPEVQFVYPVHLNPNILDVVNKYLAEVSNIKLIQPLSYPAFIFLMEKAYFILTDSGGIQEEAPSLGKPVLVMRDTTERPEAVEAGTVKLVGTDFETIVKEAQILLNSPVDYERMSKSHNPYGDGKASQRIVEFILGLEKNLSQQN